jgi:hypothetical protein
MNPKLSFLSSDRRRRPHSSLQGDSAGPSRDSLRQVVDSILLSILSSFLFGFSGNFAGTNGKLISNSGFPDLLLCFVLDHFPWSNASI